MAITGPCVIQIVGDDLTVTPAPYQDSHREEGVQSLQWIATSKNSTTAMLATGQSPRSRTVPRSMLAIQNPLSIPAEPEWANALHLLRYRPVSHLYHVLLLFFFVLILTRLGLVLARRLEHHWPSIQKRSRHHWSSPPSVASLP